MMTAGSQTIAKIRAALDDPDRRPAYATMVIVDVSDLHALMAERTELLDQMHHFANAEQRLWDETQRSPEAFKIWVRSRASHLLAKFKDMPL